MKKEADQRTKPSLNDWNGMSNENANDSGPTLEPSTSDVIALLRRWNLKAFSVLALLADYGGGVSGSESLNIFCRNSTVTDSDLDIYLPAVWEVAQDAIHVLKTSGVRWKNFLSDRIQDVRQYGITVLPYWAIYETVDMLRMQNYSMSKFREYLRKSLLGWDPESPELVKDFVTHLYNACLDVHHDRVKIKDPDDTVSDPDDTLSDPDDTVWVYAAEGSRFSSIPSAISEKINHIFEALEFRHDSHQRFNGRFENESGGDAIRELGGPNSAELKASWEKKGYHHELLQKYMNGRVMKERRQYSRAQVSALVNESLNLEPPSTGKAKITYDSRFRILHGTLPDRRNLQLIFVPTHEGGILHTILKFYASHVMSFISGTMAAHLYYSTAKERLGIIWDFKEDPRQGRAKEAIQKYKGRGWDFYEADRKTVMARHTGDEHVKFISLEDCYTSALREQNANKTLTLPSWWKDYFSEREDSFRSYGWREDCGKINTVQKKKGTRASTRLLGWVHENLAGHEDVVSSKEWKLRNDKRSVLDLWFGGVRIALPIIPRAERYNGHL
ncbi:hypothetical protein K505DRAFT_366744 [Melanomma pulvis-pyrius CBS 109.77]|uniref:Uncharacterized protein n=1 Tax=Melanomma pulvis-pyrius CBS 109.77 TaxID=1314802 RepID=A0A6A6WW57_9PLEO|nr:hypothetical protein K505DRAFT_366744 [Melanomma pulvis-pyrius CBS 109.77]